MHPDELMGPGVETAAARIIAWPLISVFPAIQGASGSNFGPPLAGKGGGRGAPRRCSDDLSPTAAAGGAIST